MGDFLYSNHCETFPPGSVIANLRTTDPDGWVIMDGVARTSTDGRYIRLYNIFGENGSIGTLGSDGNSFTPKNLKGSFLRGTGTSDSGVYSGPSLGNFQTHATQTHSHSMARTNDGSHTHANAKLANKASSNDEGTGAIDARGGRDGATALSTAITISSAPINLTASLNDSTLNVNDNETYPYNFSVNWMIKY